MLLAEIAAYFVLHAMKKSDPVWRILRNNIPSPVALLQYVITIPIIFLSVYADYLTITQKLNRTTLSKSDYSAHKSNNFCYDKRVLLLKY